MSIVERRKLARNSAQDSLDAHRNLAQVQVKAEPIDNDPTTPLRVGAAGQPPGNASNALDDLRRENEALRREKVELELRLKHSDSKAKQSKDECASLQQRLQVSVAATDAARKQVQELEAKVRNISKTTMSYVSDRKPQVFGGTDLWA